jgi:hypothetical protein
MEVNTERILYMPAEINISEAFAPLLPLDYYFRNNLQKKKTPKIRAFEECALTFYIRYSVGFLRILPRDLKSIIIDIPINGET